MERQTSGDLGIHVLFGGQLQGSRRVLRNGDGGQTGQGQAGAAKRDRGSADGDRRIGQAGVGDVGQGVAGAADRFVGQRISGDPANQSVSGCGQRQRAGVGNGADHRGGQRLVAQGLNARQVGQGIGATGDRDCAAIAD